jgi:fatty-acyl-CoA synthase
MATVPDSMADIVRARADDDGIAVRFGNETWTYRQWVQCAADRAALSATMLDATRPPHIGILLDNVAEFTMWLGAADRKSVV